MDPSRRVNPKYMERERFPEITQPASAHPAAPSDITTNAIYSFNVSPNQPFSSIHVGANQSIRPIHVPDARPLVAYPSIA
jgi:hypothetical protein